MMKSVFRMIASLLWLLVVLAIVTTTDAVNSAEPKIVAHRGLLLHAPENTLANFRACLELHLGFEFDVARTKDGELVCIHDDTVQRTTSGTGKVSERTVAELRDLDAGRWFDPKFSGEKIPTVDEVLELIGEYPRHDVLIAVDLKAAGVEQDVVRLAETHKVLPRLLFIGKTISEPEVRKQIKLASSNAHTAVVANDPTEFPQALAEANADSVYFRYLPLKEQVQATHDAGKRTFIAGATVSGNVPANWQQAADAGIDGILTDYPLELAACLRKAEWTSEP